MKKYCHFPILSHGRSSHWIQFEPPHEIGLIIAERALYALDCKLDGDPEINLTLFVSRHADGTQLLLIFIAHGETPVCHTHSGQLTKPNTTRHSQSGWLSEGLKVDSLL
jgi:hypothetical protein